MNYLNDIQAQETDLQNEDINFPVSQKQLSLIKNSLDFL